MVPGAASKGGRSAIAKALVQGPVYAQLDKADADVRRSMRASQPNFFLPFDRTGIDPFAQRFPVTLRLEGTVRGTGGLRIVDETCATSVEGLYAAGDAATRELVCGGFTGGGSHNAAWAMSSGTWAGRGAADYAKQIGSAAGGGEAARAGTVALRERAGRPLAPARLARAVQDEVFPYDLNLFPRGRPSRRIPAAARCTLGGSIRCRRCGRGRLAACTRGGSDAGDCTMDVSLCLGPAGKPRHASP